MSFSRFSPESGIAIGPILFVIALLAVLAVAVSSSIGDFGTVGVTDRVTADIVSQANLIRAKINECNIKYGTNANYDGYPSSDASDGTLVSALECDGDPDALESLWTGQRPANLPPPTSGFGPWYYINTNGSGLGGDPEGGRCIWIEPTISNPKNNAGLVNGLKRAASKFSNGTAYDANNEVIYDPDSDSQKFIMWITLPTVTPDDKCLP